MKQVVLAALMMIWAAVVAAHSPLQETNPADQTSLTTAPETLELTFKGAIRLTRVTAAVNDGAPVDLDLEGMTAFTTTFSLSLPDQGTGTYLIVWRGLGEDGHAQMGEFTFSVE